MADKEKLFRAITDVEIVESVNAEDTVLIEQDGVAKRAPKGSIGAQSDWNETDETSPAFIKNKPDVSGGGVTWITIGSYGETVPAYVGKHAWESGERLTAEALDTMFESGAVRVCLEGGLDYFGTLVGYKINGNTANVIYNNGSTSSPQAVGIELA